MTPSERQRFDRLGRRLVIALRTRFSLKDDKADDADIDQNLLASVEMKGTNLWVLMFAT